MNKKLDQSVRAGGPHARQGQLESRADGARGGVDAGNVEFLAHFDSGQRPDEEGGTQPALV